MKYIGLFIFIVSFSASANSYINAVISDHEKAFNECFSLQENQSKESCLFGLTSPMEKALKESSGLVSISAHNLIAPALYKVENDVRAHRWDQAQETVNKTISLLRMLK